MVRIRFIIQQIANRLSGQILATSHDLGPQKWAEERKFAEFSGKTISLVKKHNSMEGQIYTPLKFNVEPENESLEKEILIGKHHF